MYFFGVIKSGFSSTSITKIIQLVFVVYLYTMSIFGVARMPRCFLAAKLKYPYVQWKEEQSTIGIKLFNDANLQKNISDTSKQPELMNEYQFEDEDVDVETDEDHLHHQQHHHHHHQHQHHQHQGDVVEEDDDGLIDVGLDIQPTDALRLQVKHEHNEGHEDVGQHDHGHVEEGEHNGKDGVDKIKALMERDWIRGNKDTQWGGEREGKGVARMDRDILWREGREGKGVAGIDRDNLWRGGREGKGVAQMDRDNLWRGGREGKGVVQLACGRRKPSGDHSKIMMS